jgi:hypothetical protein
VFDKSFTTMLMLQVRFSHSHQQTTSHGNKLRMYL